MKKQVASRHTDLRRFPLPIFPEEFPFEFSPKFSPKFSPFNFFRNIFPEIPFQFPPKYFPQEHSAASGCSGEVVRYPVSFFTKAFRPFSFLPKIPISIFPVFLNVPKTGIRWRVHKILFWNFSEEFFWILKQQICSGSIAPQLIYWPYNIPRNVKSEGCGIFSA